MANAVLAMICSDLQVGIAGERRPRRERRGWFQNSRDWSFRNLKRHWNPVSQLSRRHTRDQTLGQVFGYRTGVVHAANRAAQICRAPSSWEESYERNRPSGPPDLNP